MDHKDIANMLMDMNSTTTNNLQLTQVSSVVEMSQACGGLALHENETQYEHHSTSQAHLELTELTTFSKTILNVDSNMLQAATQTNNLQLASETCVANETHASLAPETLENTKQNEQQLLLNELQQQIRSIKSKKPMGPVKIELRNVPRGFQSIEIKLQYYDESPKLYSKIYKQYEGKIWMKIPHLMNTSKSKYLFVCLWCDRKMSSTESLKNHLNRHLEFYPFSCQICAKKYPSQSSCRRHYLIHHTTNALRPFTAPDLNDPSTRQPSKIVEKKKK